MNKRDIIEFFNERAPRWDMVSVPRAETLQLILDLSRVGEGQRVLDVACGTGALFPWYLKRGVRSVTGIDIAPEMARLAAEKFAGEPRIEVVCGDVERWTPDGRYDLIMVHNALPHFPDAKRLIHTLGDMLAAGGRLTVAHSLSREAVNARHSDDARHVSRGLMPAESLKALFEPAFRVDVTVSDDEMYMVSGTSV